MMATLLLIDEGAGIFRLVFHRPEVKNAVDGEVVALLGQHLDTLEATPHLRGVVVTGSGGAFVSGGDIKQLLAHHDEASGRAFCGAMTRHLARLEQLPVPVVAAIEGVALGGGLEITLACDLRIAAQGATLGFRQIRMGLTPGWGGATRLFQLVGKQRAMRLLWEGRDLTAEEALKEGLVDRVCERGEAEASALALVRELSNRPPLAVAAVKQVLRTAAATTPEVSSTFEAEHFLHLWASEDHTEAVHAFFQRRPPVWKGH